MARKKKEQVVIVDEELRPTVLATVDEKKSGIWIMAVLFVLFIGVIYFLPTLAELYEKHFKNDNTTIIQNPNTNEGTNQEDDEPYEEIKYTFETNMVIDKETYKLTNFAYGNYVLSFNIENVSKTELDLGKDNNYLEVFSGTTLIRRIKLEDKLKAEEIKSYQYTLNIDSISYLTYNVISEEDYPVINIDDNTEVTSLVCSLEHEAYTYEFEQGKLYAIKHTASANIDDENYTILLNAYQAMVTFYKNMVGFTSYIINDTTSFNYDVTINLEEADISSMNNVHLYAKDTEAKIVNFEMESRGYNCN